MRLETYLTDDDFNNLHSAGMEWASNGWQKQIWRFDPKPMFHWQMAYWFDSYLSLIVCRAFLSSRNYETQTVFDGGMNQWAILTDYRTEVWKTK